MGEKKGKESLSPIALFGGAILKFSLPILIICALYLLVAQVGGSARNVLSLDAEKVNFYLKVFGYILAVFKISAFATCLGFICKYFFDTILGQSLTICGAMLYFGTSYFFVVLMDDPMATSMPILAQITDAFKFVGMIAFFPGLGLIARDLVLYIWDQEAVRHEGGRMLDGAKIRDKVESGSMFAIHCWGTNLCRKSARVQCEAYKLRKTCWKLKKGCYCDDCEFMKIHLKFEKSGTYNLEDLLTGQKVLSEKSKIARCKKCKIYYEHQCGKYKIAVSLVFITVIFGGYYYYPTLTATINSLAYQVDKFMSYLTTHPGVPNYNPKVDGVIITTFVLVWLGITLVTYLLKFVEYIIYELKV